jgi:hypothetical protein
MVLYLQNSVHHQQNDWVQLIRLAACNPNNITLERRNCSTLVDIHSFHRPMAFGQYSIKDSNQLVQVNPHQLAQPIEQLFSKLRAEMKSAQAIQSKQANMFQKISIILEIGVRY